MDLLVEMVRRNEILTVTQGGVVCDSSSNVSLLPPVLYQEHVCFVKNVICYLKTKSLNKAHLKTGL